MEMVSATNHLHPNSRAPKGHDASASRYFDNAAYGKQFYLIYAARGQQNAI